MAPGTLVSPNVHGASSRGARISYKENDSIWGLQNSGAVWYPKNGIPHMTPKLPTLSWDSVGIPHVCVSEVTLENVRGAHRYHSLLLDFRP